MEEEGHTTGQKNGQSQPEFENIQQHKAELLKKLPPINHEKVDKSLEGSLNVYLELAKQGKNYNTGLKNTKNFSNVEMMNTVINNFDIDEYGTNYPPELFDLKATITENDFFDKLLMKQQTNVLGFIQPAVVKPATQPTAQPKDSSKKSLWDSLSDPMGEDNRYGSNYQGLVARRSNKL